MANLLSLPSEILVEISGYLDARANTVTMEVCRTWSTVTRPLIWRNIDDYRHFWGLLKMMLGDRHVTDIIKISDSRGCLLLEAPQPERASKQFHMYRRFVLSLGLDLNVIAYRALKVISHLHHRDILFPNLRDLRLDCRDLDISMVAHPRLERLIIIARFQLKSWPTLGLTLPLVLRDLVYLEFSSEIDAKYDEIITDLLRRGLRNLQTLVFPITSATCKLLGSLAGLTSLRAVIPNFRGTSFTIGNTSLNSLRIGAFPALHTLTISDNPDKIIALLQDQNFPGDIDVLTLDMILPGSFTPISSIFDAITSKCNRLRECTIYERIPTREIFTMSDIRPIFAQGNVLVTLDITLYNPLKLLYEDMEEIARALPVIEKLFLIEVHNAGATSKNIPHALLPISVLAPLAHYCPRLKRLGLFIDTSHGPETMSATIQPFLNLRELYVGKFPLPISDEFAEFIGKIVPPRFQGITSGGRNIEDIHRVWLGMFPIPYNGSRSRLP